MLDREVLSLYALMDKADASAVEIRDFLMRDAPDGVHITTETIKDDIGFTTNIKVIVEGENQASPSLLVVGRLGAIGARPDLIGYVSDGDGALCALSAALKLIEMKRNGDNLPGTVIFSTHIKPDAKVEPREPADFIEQPVHIDTLNYWDVIPHKEISAVLSVDTTKGNKIANQRGFYITPTAKCGYILPVSDDLVDIMIATTGRPAKVLPLSQFDLTLYESGFPHINSLMTPSTGTFAPTVGVAITTESVVAGSATGASHLSDVEEAARFVIEVAKAFTSGKISFHDESEYETAVKVYGDLSKFQKETKNASRF